LNVATRWPRLTFASVAKPEGPRCALDFTGLALCSGHASTDPNDYMTDESWQKVVAAVKAKGRAYPDRESLHVLFIPLTPSRLH